MKELYKRILEKLKDETKWSDAGLEKPFVDLYRRQPEEPTRFEFYNTPAILIDWNIKYNSSVNNNTDYEGTVSIYLHIVLNSYGDTSSLADDTTIDEALRMFDFYKVVQNQIDGLSSQSISKLIRSGENTDTIDVNSYHIISYTGTYSEDNSGEIYNYIDDVQPVVHKTTLKTHIPYE